ncbi:serine hydrolase domain-containing protein [Enterococcus sp. DIV0187]|uniref:serine hydrolase domain-containing protein n=1 Tax=Enterococcus sp. DIV0187 TaxID=2774644 RepID=UPI003F21E7F7
MKSYFFKLAISSILLIIGIGMPVMALAATEQADMDRYLESEFKKTHIPGMSVEIVSQDQVAFAKGYGDCIGADQPFIIGSLSKSITAVAIMQLVESDRVELDSPVARYLEDISPKSKTTVKQLLTHTSGIRTYDKVTEFRSNDKVTEYEYANTNYTLLGRIIERVTGMTYSDYVQANIFEPLAMEKSGSSLKFDKGHGLIAGHQSFFGSMREVEEAYPADNSERWLTLPAGYLISSSEDMGKYMQLFLLGANVGILSPESLEEMQKSSVAVTENYGYGYGLGIDSRSGSKRIVHGGNVENYTTYMIMDPEKKVGIITMFNGADFLGGGNELVIELTENALDYYLGDSPKKIDATSYKTQHRWMNLIFVAILVVAILPVVFLRKWIQRNKNGITVLRSMVLGCGHIILPTALLFWVPHIIQAPLGIIRSWGTDVYLVLVLSSSFLYVTGLVKLAYLIRPTREKRGYR